MLVRSGLRLLALILLIAPAGCVPPGHAPGHYDPDRPPTWPYAGVTAGSEVPPELTGRALLIGHWLQAFPDGLFALAETSLPRYLLTVPIGSDRGGSFLDLGPGAAVETLAFDPGDDTVFLVAAVTNPHQRGNPVSARAVLEVDGASWFLTQTTPLGRDSFCRGFAIAPDRGRAYLYEESGDGSARISKLDLYQGAVTARHRAGTMPASVNRKGLVLDRDDRTVFCLVGGEARHDFAPLGEGPGRPVVGAYAAEDLSVRGFVPLPEGFEPRAMAYDAERELLCVLVTDFRRSLVVLIDGGFLKTRVVIDLPEDTTDLVLSGGYAFAPGAHGVYIVDLASEAWISRPAVGFETTGEMAVAADQRTALVQFSSRLGTAGAGIAVVDLTTGTVREIWN